MKKRLEAILWEKNNDYPKFKTHGWEYFEEFLPLITKSVCEVKPEPKMEVPVEKKPIFKKK